nr:MAG TPA: hypothetical protein [Crassvirales sp.]
MVLLAEQCLTVCLKSVNFILEIMLKTLLFQEAYQLENLLVMEVLVLM